MAAPGMKSYPTAAFVLTLIGGILVILDGLYTAAIAAYVSSTVLNIIPGLSAILLALGIVALLFGLIMVVGAVKMRSNPESARTWGIIVLIISLISIIGGGGFIFGLILGLVGGILAIVWHRPTMAQPAWGQPAGTAMGAPASSGGPKTCSSCGSPNAAGTQFCAKCGAALPP